MLLSADRRLEELIIETLASEPRLTAEELRSRTPRPFTIQAVYQELRKLERAGVIVRKHGEYSLRLLWLVELAELAEKGFQTFLKSGALLNELPDAGQKQRWTLNGISQLLDLWSDLTFLLVRTLAERERVLYEFVEHVWFHTANSVNEDHFIRAMKRDNVRYVLVSAGKTHLDRTYEEILRELGATYSFGQKGFPARDGQYMSVLGDYVIDVKLSKSLATHVRDFYAAASSASQLRAQDLLHFAASRGRCQLELSCNPVRAKRERLKFVRFFGLRSD